MRLRIASRDQAKAWGALMAIATLLAYPLPAAGAPQQRNSGPTFAAGGLLFGDIYGVANHHLPEAPGSFGGWIRRGYLTADADFDGRWFARFRLELNQSGQFESYDFDVDFKDHVCRRRSRRSARPVPAPSAPP